MSDVSIRTTAPSRFTTLPPSGRDPTSPPRGPGGSGRRKVLAPLVVATMMVLSLLVVPGTTGDLAPQPLPEDGDISSTVVQPVAGGVALCFYDVQGDGTLNAGDFVYLDPRADTCGTTVGSGVIRLTASGGHAAFTRVSIVDADFNLAYSPCCGATPGLADGGRELDFFDADANGRFNGGDTMYADADADDLVSPGDLRWVPYGHLPAGTLVAVGDADVGLGLHTPDAGSDALDASFAFADVDGDGTYGHHDGAYLDLSQGGAGTPIAVNDIRLLGAHAGQVVSSTASDVTPLLDRIGPGGVAVCFRSTNADAVYDVGEPLYVDVDSDTCGPQVEVNDLRLTASGAYAAFTTVRTTDDDHGLALHGSGGPGTTSAGIADGGSEIDFFDADGNGVFNAGDSLYADVDGDNVVTPGDYRWTPFGGLGGGTIVAGEDPDVGFGLRASSPGLGSHALDQALSFWDIDGFTSFDGNDVPYLDLGQVGPHAVVEVNDVRLGAFGDHPGGQIVQYSDSDAVATLQPMNEQGVSICFHSTNGDARYDAGEPLYLKTRVDAGPCGAVQANDIRLTGSGSFQPFTTVRSGDADIHLALIGSEGSGTSSAGLADGGSEIDFYDADGNGGYSPGDTLYADVDGDNDVSIGDLRWGPFGGLAPGTVAAAGDVDLNLALFMVGSNTGAFPLDEVVAFWDLDNDHAFASSDKAFLHLDAFALGGYVHARDVVLEPGQGPPPADDQDRDDDGWQASEDCNDDDNAIHPNNNELDNGVDDDCDGLVDEGLDHDGDGHTPITGGDCDDSDVTVHPGQNEVDNGVDDDCDGLIDDGYDLDSDGYTPLFGGDCDDASAAVNPGQNEVDNGVDDDCDGVVDEGYDLDGDSYTPIFGGDCNDGDPLIHPNNNERDNGLDDDCDGSVDEGLDLDLDSFTPIFGGDCDDGDPLIHPGADERDNVIDDDCDGVVDEGIDSDHDGLDYPAEQAAGTDPFDADTDDDGLVDGQELHAWNTDPLDPDTDDDRFEDGREVQCGSDPNDPLDFLPTQCLVPTLP